MSAAEVRAAEAHLREDRHTLDGCCRTAVATVLESHARLGKLIDHLRVAGWIGIGDIELALYGERAPSGDGVRSP